MSSKQTDRGIDLVRPSSAYAGDVYAYGSDEAFCAYLDSDPFASVTEAESFIASLIEANESGARDYWLVRDVGEDRVIGTIGFIFYLDRSQGIADLGYGIARSHWGGGSFQAAGKLILHYGFEELGLARIQVTTRADNIAAIRGVEKLGFRREALLHQYCRTRDGRVDGVLLYLLRGMYPLTDGTRG